MPIKSFADRLIVAPAELMVYYTWVSQDKITLFKKAGDEIAAIHGNRDSLKELYLMRIST